MRRPARLPACPPARLPARFHSSPVEYSAAWISIYRYIIGVSTCRDAAFEISTRSSRFVAQRAAILAALTSLRFREYAFPRERHIVSSIIHLASVAGGVSVHRWIGNRVVSRRRKTTFADLDLSPLPAMQGKRDIFAFA